MAKNLITFPKGKGSHLALKRPDTKFHDLGVYKADFILDEETAKPYIAKLQAIAKKHTGKEYPVVTTADSKAMKSANPLFIYEADADGNKTGNVIFKARVKNSLSKKTSEVWDRRPALIDALKRPVEVNPWGGSTIRVQCEVVEGLKPEKYVKLVPVVVQVIELVEGSGGDTSAFDEEDGFAGEEAVPTEKADASDDGDY